MQDINILKTNEANCKDCYKCLRYCPIKAIRVCDGHAQVDKDRCVLDGKCLTICPQKAKSVRNDVEKAKEVIKYGDFIVASIAPSFFAYYDKSSRGKIITALKYLGFDQIEQTSRAAYSVALAHFEHMKNTDMPVIASSCPSIVTLVEKYYPELISNLAPVLSPMCAHYQMLFEQYGKNFKMIFIGPCVAKKEEIEGTNIAACLTFSELDELIKQEELDLDTLPESEFEKEYSGNPSLFPLIGGLIKTAGMDDSNIQSDLISISGIEDARKLFDSIINKSLNIKFIEALACEGGCIMGPAKPDYLNNKSFYELKDNIIQASNENTNSQPYECISIKKISRKYTNKSFKIVEPSEEEIRIVLASIGKFVPEDELNCGACGYNSCRDKAIAVIQGLAEKEMCIPFMKAQAEKLSSVIIEATPNSVVIMDDNLVVIDANPAFLKFFNLNKDDITGYPLSGFMDDAPFKELLAGVNQLIETRVIYNNREVKRIIFSVPDKKLVTGIFVDISDAETHREALLKVKQETLERAQKVINKQMRVAQEIAGLLGETTAETKVLLGQLVKILQQE